MNKFEELIQALKERAAAADLKADPTLFGILRPSEAVTENGPERQFRLPYSSDPKPVEDSWA